jgi:hypothetical protein
VRPFEGFRARKVAEITAHYEAFLAPGYPLILQGVAETLQVAREVDRTNWLTLLGICNEAVLAGVGDQTIPVPLRCTSNRSYFMTFAECASIIRALRAWGAAAQFNWWRLKDLARACPSRDDLNGIDITEGYP